MSDLINTLDTPGEFDALTKLRPDEPYFLLLGRDRLAPALVQAWADKNRARALDEFGSGVIGKDKRDRELAKSTEAEAIGWAMQAFKAGDMSKRVQEQPTAKTYTGFQLPEETQRRDAIQAARAHATAALANAIAHVAALEELLTVPLPEHVPASLAGTTSHVLAAMQAAADDMRPPSRAEILRRK